MEEVTTEEQVDVDMPILEGSPLDGPLAEDTILEEEAPDPSLQEVTISGKTFEVNNEVADAISELERGVDRKLSETSVELGELRKFQRNAVQGQSLQEEPVPVEPKYDYEQGFYSDTNKAVSHLKKEIMEEMAMDFDKKRQAESDANAFWDNFWSENKDLEKVKEDAQPRIMGGIHKYSHLPDNKATRDIMARDVRSYYLGIAKNFDGNNGNEGASNYSEGAGQKSVVREEKAEEAQRKTTAQLLKESRQKKNEALLNNK